MKEKNTLFKLVFKLIFLVFSFGFWSNLHAEKKEEFNVNEMIMHHVKDAHEWHLWGSEHDGVSLYLPVIVYDKEFKIFNASCFYHGNRVSQTDAKTGEIFTSIELFSKTADLTLDGATLFG